MKNNTLNTSESTSKYFAFISYKREDEKWAKWLQRKLEYYKLPIELRKRKPEIPQFLRPIFVDTTELNGSILIDSIYEALDASLYLIVICSPNTPKSEWVNKEVRYFIENKNISNIIPFIVDGIPYSEDPAHECLPYDIKIMQQEHEILCININENGRNAATTRIVSRMLGVSFDSLWQRHKRDARLKNNIKFIFLSLLLLISFIISLLFITKNKQIKEQYWQILKTQSVAVADLADRLTERGDAFLATKLSLEVLPKDLSDPDRPYTTEAERALRNATSTRSGLFKGHTDGVYSIVMNRKGTFIATGSEDKTIKIWDPRNGVCLETLEGHQYGIRHIELNQDETLLLSLDYEGNIFIWDLENMNSILTIEGDSSDATCKYAKFYNGSNSTIAMFQNNSLCLWDITSRQLIKETKFNTSILDDCIWIGDKYLVTKSFYNGITIHNVKTGKPIKYYNNRSATISIDEKYIAILSESDKLEIYDIDSHNLINRIDVSQDCNMLSFSPNGKYLAAASGTIHVGEEYYPNIEVFDIYNGECLKTFYGHDSSLEHITWSHDSNYILTASSDHNAGIWEIHPSPQNTRYLNHSVYEKVKHAKYSPSGSKIIYSTDNTIKVINTTTDSILLEINDCIDRPVEYIKDILLGPDEMNIISIAGIEYLGLLKEDSSARSYIKIWDSTNGKLIRTHYFDSDSEINNIYFSNDGTIYAASTRARWIIESTNTLSTANVRSFYFNKEGNCVIYIWDYATGKLITELSGHTQTVNSIVFTNDNKKLISCSADKTIRIWDIHSGKQLMAFSEHTGDVRSIVLTPDNSRIISCSHDKTIRIWNIEKGILETTIEAHDQEINDLLLSKDASTLVSCSVDRKIKIWSMDSYEPTHTIQNGMHWNNMCLNYNCDHLIAIDNGGTLYIYNIQSGSPIIIFKKMGIDEIDCHPYMDNFLCIGNTNLTELSIKPLQNIINQAGELYKSRELSEQECQMYYLSPR